MLLLRKVQKISLCDQNIKEFQKLDLRVLHLKSEDAVILEMQICNIVSESDSKDLESNVAQRFV